MLWERQSLPWSLVSGVSASTPLLDLVLTNIWLPQSLQEFFDAWHWICLKLGDSADLLKINAKVDGTFGFWDLYDWTSPLSLRFLHNFHLKHHLQFLADCIPHLPGEGLMVIPHHLSRCCCNVMVYDISPSWAC